MKRLRKRLLTYLLRPVALESLHLGPHDCVVVRTPEEGIRADMAIGLARQIDQALPGRSYLFVVESMRLEAVPREFLLVALEHAQPSRLPYGTTV